MSEQSPIYRTSPDRDVSIASNDGGHAEAVHDPGIVAITPPPGVYPGTPNHIYHNQWQAASNSRLTKLHRSPAHLRAYLDAPPEDTTALIIGRAAHAAILEPDDFANRYVKAPTLDRRTKEGKATWAELELRFGPGYVLKGPEYDVCIGVRDAVHAHASARRLHVGPREVELSLRWNDAETGVACKARPDCHCPDVAGGILWDIKTTKDASPREFERSIFVQGYHRQAAFYLDAARALGLPAEHFVIVAVEKEPPFAVAVYRLTDSAVDAGREQLRPLLRRYAYCVEHNEWPAYGDAIVDISLPTWAWNTIDEEVAIANAGGAE